MMFAAELARSVGRLSDADADRHRSILESARASHHVPPRPLAGRCSTACGGTRSPAATCCASWCSTASAARHPRRPGHVAAVRRLPGDCLLMHMVKGGTSEWPDAGFPGIRINPESLMPQIVNEDVVGRGAGGLDGPRGPDLRPARRRARGRSRRAPRRGPLQGPRLAPAADLRGGRAPGLEPVRPGAWRCSASSSPRPRAPWRRPPSASTSAGPTSPAANVGAAVESFAKALDLRVAGSADAALDLRLHGGAAARPGRAGTEQS